MLHKRRGFKMYYTATQIAKKLGISRSYLYCLKENSVVEMEVNENGKVLWSEAVYQRLKEYLKKIGRAHV